jgi:hypothetical protein
MGCASSTANEKKRAQEHEERSTASEKHMRRRLSVGEVNEQVEDIDEDRGSQLKITQQGILELMDMQAKGIDVPTNGRGPIRRRYSIGSETDKELNKRHSFKKKDEHVEGDDFTYDTCGFGFTCRKGLKPESPNQDSWVTLVAENDFSIYGVFDGHG